MTRRGTKFLIYKGKRTKDTKDYLIEAVIAARDYAEASRVEYLRLLRSGADDTTLVAAAERLHAAALAWAEAEERAGTITDVGVVAGDRIAHDRAGHVHHIGTVDSPPVLGARAEGCYLVLPASLGGVE